MKFSNLVVAAEVAASSLVSRNATESSGAMLNAATFMYARNGASVTTTITAAADTNDLFFRLSFPTAYDWAAVGVGATMKGAFMLVTYPSADGRSMTLSSRRASGNNEPVYDKNINCKIVDNANPNVGDEVTLGIMCHNATHYSQPALDLSSSTAPFMWALGPITWNNGTSWSNDSKQPLRIHSAVTQFTMDMTAATVPTNPDMVIPQLGNATISASADAKVTQTQNLKTPAHGLLMIIAIIVLVPLDSVIKMCMKSDKVHMLIMGAVTVVFTAGSALGFIVSGLFNRSKSYNSAHQVIGLIIFILFFSQIPLGVITMLRRNKTNKLNGTKPLALADNLHNNAPITNQRHQYSQRKLPLYKAHLGIAALIALLTIITGGLGFQLSLGAAYTVKYVLFVVGVFLVWLGVVGIRYMWMRRSEEAIEDSDEARDRRNRAEIQAYQMKAWDAQQQRQQQESLNSGVGLVISEREVEPYPTESIRRT